MKQAKEPVAAKVDPELKRMLEQAAEETETTLSVISYRGLQYYAEENPDGYEAFGSEHFVDQILEEL